MNVPARDRPGARKARESSRDRIRPSSAFLRAKSAVTLPKTGSFMSAISSRQIMAIAAAFGVPAALSFLAPARSELLIAAVVGGVAAYAASVGTDTEPLRKIRTALRRIAQGKQFERPQTTSDAEASVYDELEELRDAFLDDSPGSSPKIESAEIEALDNALLDLEEAIDEDDRTSREAIEAIKTAKQNLTGLSANVQTLATSADESSSSVLEMSATTDEVAENIGELATSVREMVASIEEMAFSIREVATNVDELSLTAEETSSSMNQMDVAIDQVQSNADETSRLSEEVAQDAEQGAESILKTMGEIYRIKESSQEALGVINSLGSRIDAIGEILNVIDDVAEQTNLLALNAAIIAAQAGEHGKGFAVVADEIKDLAERAGASTKEIADLIKTIQAESKNAISAVEQSSQNVDRGVEVSNEAERALKKILESSQKSTNMVRAIARATVEQAKGSKQVTDAISRIAETVQQVAAATSEQARGSELIMKNGEKMRTISQQVERSSQEQARGGRRITEAIESINNMVSELNHAQRDYSAGSDHALTLLTRVTELQKQQRQQLRRATDVSKKLRGR